MNTYFFPKKSEAVAIWGAIKADVSIADQSSNGYSSVVTGYEFSEIPASFFAGLEDIKAGRVIDMERALSEPPPPDV